MQYILGIGGLAMNLVGAVIIAWADGWFVRSVDVSLLAIEMNFLKLWRLLRKGGAEAIVTDMDEHRDQVARRGQLWKQIGWSVLIAGYVLQIIAVCIAWLAAT